LSIVKSLAVGEGDMYYIKHGADSFTIIDCCMADDVRAEIIDEIITESRDKGVVRFISTHPDNDHILGLADLDDALGIRNFYCVQNEATKPEETADFKRYCDIRDDSEKTFYIRKGSSRKWLNESDAERGSAGINILWPDTSNEHYKAALQAAKEGQSPNNISCILSYKLEGGATMLWMGDLETEFMEKVEEDLQLRRADVLFAPHHGRHTGKVPAKWLDAIRPQIVVLGECPSDELDYYEGYNTLTQNSAGEIVFLCEAGKVHIYLSNHNYSVDFLDDEGKPDTYGKYIGTLDV